MPAFPPPASGPNPALVRSVLDGAAAGGSALMGKLVAAARTTLRSREVAARDLRERDALAASAQLLLSREDELRTLYVQALRTAFADTDRGRQAEPAAAGTVQFDQLELMDEWQVQESVTVARAQQVASLATDSNLAELNTLVASAQGLKTVRPERNPLRPEVYVTALKEVLGQMPVPEATRLNWLDCMGAALGQELRKLYDEVSARLRLEGVVAAGYAVLQTPSSGAGGGGGGAQAPSFTATDVGAGAPATAAEPTLQPLAGGAAPPARAPAGNGAVLTLDRLRRLLAGELDQQAGGARAVESFAQRFSREFESGPAHREAPETDFDATMPAALEALQEMKQVDQVVQRLEQRRSAPAAARAAQQGARPQASGVAQALSLEVVALMVDNIARDARLLAPMQRLVRELEPALLRLALADPRFFTDKQHPARVLLQEMTHRSLAYASEQAPGCTEFMRALQQAVAPLAGAEIDNAEPFEQVLGSLRSTWGRLAQRETQARDRAVEVLQHAEQRNVLAEKIGREIESHADASRVPPVVIDFLCGPWAQVVAQARMAGTGGAAVANKYQALISALLWSTHPELTRQNTAKLTRLVPLLLATLREGLETISYPVTKTSAFLEALMGLHQMAFESARKPAGAPAAAPVVAPAPLPARAHGVQDGDPWVAPEEARTSNFMELPDMPQAFADDVSAAAPSLAAAEADAPELALGTWVELRINGQWMRTQLTWTSPHGTLFLFTSAVGTTQSMTRRSRDKLMAVGSLRIISGQPVVDGALDAVAQTAMRNSMDITL